MSEWQPIETAPKDEAIYDVCTSDFLVWAGRVCVAAWFNSWKYDQRYPKAEKDGGWVIPGGHVIEPTHWQPLPNPPKQ